ncbi:nuclear pore complex protein DDB_G0274915 [Centropristis striata]|uniref:nuclear pore complex protein DDB_G0274915 n=1 Tax=Centropristis striata TaxID=184440 RepID=UPI0027E0549D|nr:nuclear pore complex protein DDB_G0274915 [Centropristis striata]
MMSSSPSSPASASPTTMTSGASASSTFSQSSTTSGSTATPTTNQSPSTTPSSTASPTTQFTTSTTIGVGLTGMTTSNPAMPTTSGKMATAGGTMLATSGNMPTKGGTMLATGGNMPTKGRTMPATGGQMQNTGVTRSPPIMTSGSGSMNSMMTTSMSSNSTGGWSSMNGTNMIYCPSFTCNYTDCYRMYNSQNATTCDAGVYCELIRQTDMCYIASCSVACAESCVNASQTNCSIACCNSTGCLNDTFASMMITSAMIPTTTTAMTMGGKSEPASTTTTSPQTTEDKRNKCNSGECIGADCYKSFSTVQSCSSSEPHCQLKKETKDSGLLWTAGCFTNCSEETPCKENTSPPCHLECCNATMTSCLMLNGTLNVPNVATGGPHLHMIASLLCLLTMALLL